jgi:hypothetical protein
MAPSIKLTAALFKNRSPVYMQARGGGGETINFTVKSDSCETLIGAASLPDPFSMLSKCRACLTMTCRPGLP